MYNYLYAVGRYKDYQPGFHVVDISKNYVKDLEKLFSVLYIVIEDKLYNKKITITLDDYRLDFLNNPTFDIQQWLDSKTQIVLKTVDVVPGKDRLFVKLERLFTNGYFHSPGDLNLAKDRQEDLFSDSAPDIRISHYKFINGIDYKKQVDYSLITCNGLFYRTVGRDDGIYVLGAGFDYIQNKKDLRFGALNFEKIGKVKTIPITADILTKLDINGPASWKINLKDYDLSNKTIWLVLNGQLITDQEMLYQVGEKDLMFKPVAFDAMRHYQVYREFTRTPKLVNMKKMDAYKAEALLAHNSFIVLIDNPTLGIEVSPLTNFHYPNVLHTEERFPHPIVLENGLFPVPYAKTYGIGQRLLNHDIRFLRNYPVQTTGTLDGNLFNSLQVNQGDPGRLPRGFFFKIFGVSFGKV